MALRSHWLLEDGITFLNHGSFGACPKVVLEAQHQMTLKMEREPVRFIARELEGRLDRSRQALGQLLGADVDGLAFVPNATTGVNTVLQSLSLKPGDEMLTTNHVYGACRNAMNLVAERAGAKVVEATVPFPLLDPKVVVDQVVSAFTDRTRLLLLDHVTSPTGLVFPVTELVQLAESRGIPALIDGAHAPGMLDLNLEALGASYYTGNCHKWLCTPKGSAFLFVRADRRTTLRPLVTSHGYTSPRTDRSRFRLEFDFSGTDDFTPFLVIPEAIAFLEGLFPGGLTELRRENHARTLRARDRLCEVLGIAKPAPDEMLGSLAAVPLPDATRAPTNPAFGDELAEALFEQDAIEVPVFAFPIKPKRLLRIAVQAYNTDAEFERLATRLRHHLARAS